jgi:hypothetical protein
VSGYIIGSGINFLVGLVRYRISDLKILYNNVTQENAGNSTGNAQIIYTANMPITSGFDSYLRVGRWLYTPVASQAAASGIRGYVFDSSDGSFTIPSGAVLPSAGQTIGLSYTWSEEQPYKFTDNELKMYLGDAVSTVNNSMYNFGHTFIANPTNDTYTIYPEVGTSEIAGYIYAMYASYLIKKQLESEGFGDRIFVRDINITIDTSKGLGDLQKSAKDLYVMIQDVIKTLLVKGQEAAFARIDTYSTYPRQEGYLFDSNYQKDNNYF